jgi:endonuclease III
MSQQGGTIDPVGTLVPLELLVATILSAQTTDRQVNEVTRVLFTPPGDTVGPRCRLG